MRISVDHIPILPEEEARIEQHGGFVSTDGRVNGILAVARALGDVFLQPMVSPEPFVYSAELNPRDEFLILACDGLWDVFEDQDAVDFVRPLIDTPQVAASRLRDAAFTRGSTDNISVIVVSFADLFRDSSMMVSNASIPLSPMAHETSGRLITDS